MLYLGYSVITLVAIAWLYLMSIVYVEAFGPMPTPQPRPARIVSIENYRISRWTDAYARTNTEECHRVVEQAVAQVSPNILKLKALDNRDLHLSLNELVRHSCPDKKIQVLKPIRLPLAA